MKTNGPGKMLFIIDRLWVVVLSKSGPGLFSKPRPDTQDCLNCFESDLSLPIKRRWRMTLMTGEMLKQHFSSTQTPAACCSGRVSPDK